MWLGSLCLVGLGDRAGEGGGQAGHVCATLTVHPTERIGLDFSLKTTQSRAVIRLCCLVTGSPGPLLCSWLTLDFFQHLWASRVPLLCLSFSSCVPTLAGQVLWRLGLFSRVSGSLAPGAVVSSEPSKPSREPLQVTQFPFP